MSTKEIAHDKHVLFLRSFDIWLVADGMEDPSPHKPNKSKITRLGILGDHFSEITFCDGKNHTTYIEMCCQCKEIHRLTILVQKATLSEVLDAKSKMVQVGFVQYRSRS